jgi:molybdate transport system regulatory protein
MTRLTIRIDFDDGSALGPGKARLLELIGETGSIRKAAAGMKMSYRRAWLLLQALEAMFGAPLAETATGGKAGGGARLTRLGAQAAARYRRLERAATAASAKEMNGLARLVKGKSQAGVRRSVVPKSRK